MGSVLRSILPFRTPFVIRTLIRQAFLLPTLAVFLSLNAFSQSPGGVNANLKMWLKANTGVTGTTNVSNWADQSGSGNNATQGVVANQPSLVTNDLNFNPTINSFNHRIRMKTRITSVAEISISSSPLSCLILSSFRIPSR